MTTQVRYIPVPKDAGDDVTQVLIDTIFNRAIPLWSTRSKIEDQIAEAGETSDYAIVTVTFDDGVSVN